MSQAQEQDTNPPIPPAIQKVGCSICTEVDYDMDAPHPKGGVGIPGLVFVIDRRWGHVSSDKCTDVQLAKAKPCTNPTHDNDCQFVITSEVEAVGPCQCNPDWIHPEMRAKIAHAKTMEEKESLARRTVRHEQQPIESPRRYWDN